MPCAETVHQVWRRDAESGDSRAPDPTKGLVEASCACIASAAALLNRMPVVIRPRVMTAHGQDEAYLTQVRLPHRRDMSSSGTVAAETPNSV